MPEYVSHVPGVAKFGGRSGPRIDLLESGSASWIDQQSSYAANFVAINDDSIRHGSRWHEVVADIHSQIDQSVSAANVITLPILHMSNASVAEGDTPGSYYARTLDFLVTFDSPLAGPVTVTYTTEDGSASDAASDYVGVSDSITFPAGTSSGYIRIEVDGDRLIERDETVLLVLTGISGAGFEGNAAAMVGVGTILNDDSGIVDPRADNGLALQVSPPRDQGGAPVLSVVSTSINEGDFAGSYYAAYASVYLVLSKPAPSNIQLSYNTLSGSASSVTGDFRSESGTAVIPAGTQVYSLTFQIDGDQVAEGDESFSVRIGNVIGALLDSGGNSTTATVLIRDNEAGGSAGQIAAGPQFHYAGAHHFIGLADFNSDGHSDLLWRNVNGALSTWQVSGDPGRAVQRAVYNAQVDPSWKVVETIDFNGDGMADILWRQDGGAFSIWNALGGGRFQPGSFTNGSVGNSWRIAATGDFNGDGRDDLLWQNSDGAVSVWHATGLDFVQNSYFHSSVGASWRVVGTGDFNGDGSADILWREAGGAVSIWSASSNGFVEGSYYDPSVSSASGWRIVGIGDFNGDGRDDLAWRNDSGQISIWRSAGSGFDKNVYFNAGIPSSWSIKAVADFNGDGRADLLWRSDGGAISTWESNGNGFNENVTFDASVPPDWALQSHGFLFG